jgi:hypothetical protein
MPPGPRDRAAGVAVLLGLLVFGVVLSVGQASLRDEPTDASVAAPVSDLLGDRGWTEVAGEWAAADGQVRVARLAPQGGRNLLVADLGWLDGEVTATFAEPAAGAALVLRYRSPEDFWVLVPAPGYATWAMQHVVAGDAVENVELGLQEVGVDTRVAVSLLGRVAIVTIGDHAPVTVPLDDDGGPAGDEPAATQAGFTVVGFGAEAGRWSTFDAVRAP